MPTVKDNLAVIKALAAVFCCTVLITQSGRLFGQDTDNKAAPPATVKQSGKEPVPSDPDAADEKAGEARAENEIPPLAEMLAIALENNPDIGVAASQVQAAQAQLKRTQLSVVQQVMDLQEAWHTQQKLIDHARASIDAAEKQWKFVKANHDTGQPAGTLADLGAAEEQKIKAETALILAQARLAEIKAKIPYVLGTQKPPVVTGRVSKDGTGRVRGTTSAPAAAANPKVDAEQQNATPPAEANLNMPAAGRESENLSKLRSALDDQSEVDFVDIPLHDAVGYFSDLHNIQITLDDKAFKEVVGDEETSKEPHLTIRLAGVSLGATLQAIMDLYPQVVFVVRDYGLLVTVKGNEPVGAIPVAVFWKQPPGAAGFGGGGAFGGAGAGQF